MVSSCAKELNKSVALPLEKDYLSDIESNLKAAGAVCVRLNAGLAKSLTGDRIIRLAPASMPDLLVIMPNQVTFLEVKRPVTGKVSPGQKRMIARLREMGCNVAVVKSVDEALAACQIPTIQSFAEFG